jgi:hypothetical protein
VQVEVYEDNENGAIVNNETNICTPRTH